MPEICKHSHIELKRFIKISYNNDEKDEIHAFHENHDFDEKQRLHDFHEIHESHLFHANIVRFNIIIKNHFINNIYIPPLKAKTLSL